jgi:SRSO17 transposase
VFEDGFAVIAGRFGRREPRMAARAFVTGLLSTVERKTCWSLAEQAGYGGPAPMQRLLRTARWDAGAAGGDVRGFVAQRLGHPDGVLVPDETGFVKKGRYSVGVQRQYTGTAGRVENSQVGVFLAYASPRGRALLDRRLYLPQWSWCADEDRRDRAGVPAGVGFATKPRLAAEMIDAALDAGVDASWVAADEVYGSDPDLRIGLETRGVGYVLAIGGNRYVTVNRGRTRMRVDTIADGLGSSCWQRMSAGEGAKGPRDYDWAAVAIGTNANRWLLMRANPSTGELAFYLCWSPSPVPLATLVRVAGARWAVEECFQAAKTHIGLDHYQVRGWTGWHRFTVLALLALAILAVCAATDPAPVDPTRHARHNEPIALTTAEIRRLFNLWFIQPIRGIGHHLRWSIWRRRHQARARQAHYQQRLARLTDHQVSLEY